MAEVLSNVNLLHLCHLSLQQSNSVLTTLQSNFYITGYFMSSGFISDLKFLFYYFLNTDEFQRYQN